MSYCTVNVFIPVFYPYYEQFLAKEHIMNKMDIVPASQLQSRPSFVDGCGVGCGVG